MAKTICNNPATSDQAKIIQKNKRNDLDFICWLWLAWANTVLPLFAWMLCEQSVVVYVQTVVGDSERGCFYFTFSYLLLQQLIIYAFLRYCQSRRATLIKFVRIGICPAISMVAGYLCGYDYLRFTVSVSWTASGLFVFLSWIDSMPRSPEGKAGSLSPAGSLSRERQDIEIFEISKHVLSLEVRDGCGVLYDHEHGAMFRFNDKLLSIVRLIVFWIVEQSLAELLRDKFVSYAEFASKDLVLFLQDHHGVLYLHCGSKVYIKGDELLPLMKFMKSLSTSLSVPLMLPSIIPMHSCKQFTAHGIEALLLKWLFGEPQKCLTEKLPIDLKQFHRQALLIPMGVKDNSLLTYNGEQEGCSTKHLTADLHDQRITKLEQGDNEDCVSLVDGDLTLTYHEEEDGCLTENPAADLQDQEITEVKQDDIEDCVSQVDGDQMYSGQNEPSDGASNQQKHLIEVQMISRFMVLLFLINEILS